MIDEIINSKYGFINDRGLAWQTKGDLDRAISDFTEAIQLEPKGKFDFKGVYAYANRGRARFYQGDYLAAVADLSTAAELDDNAYTLLWRFLARSRSAHDGASELSASAARHGDKDWPYAVIDFYLGRRSMDEMRAAAAKPPEKCDPAFYLGEWHLLRGNACGCKTSVAGGSRYVPQELARILWCACRVEAHEAIVLPVFGAVGFAPVAPIKAILGFVRGWRSAQRASLE